MPPIISRIVAGSLWRNISSYAAALRTIPSNTERARSLLGGHRTRGFEAVEIGDRLVDAYDVAVFLVHIE
jgi:hypothetical protein